MRSPDGRCLIAKDLAELGGKARTISHVSMDMSAAYLKGVQQELPLAAICCDRFHVAALAGKAMDEVRSAEFKTRPAAVAQALGELSPANRRGLSWAICTHHAAGTDRHMQAMYTLPRTNLQSARAWRLQVALREVYNAAAHSHSPAEVRAVLLRWIGWAMRSPLEPFKRMARALWTHIEGVIAGIQHGGRNAFVAAMNGLEMMAGLMQDADRDLVKF